MSEQDILEDLEETEDLEEETKNLEEEAEDLEDEEEGLEELELESLPHTPEEEDSGEQSNATRPSTHSKSSRNSRNSAKIPIPTAELEVPEGAVLQTLKLQTDPNEDDFAKYLVRIGRLGIDDVVEVVDSDGYIIGTKVLPHAETRYLEEVALEEAVRRMPRTDSAISAITADSEQLMKGILPNDYIDELEDDFEEGFKDEQDEGEEARESLSKSEENDSFENGGGGPLRHPKTVESLYQLIEPQREDEFNEEIDHLNRQIVHIQKEFCSEHKLRKMMKEKKFIFDKNIIMGAVSETGLLYLPGNFLDPIVGRRLNDSDISLILDTIKDIPDTQFKGFSLAYNEITDEGITALAQFIQDRPNIVYLNFAHNDFTAAGLHTLVTHLINRPSLQTLKITGVKVGDEGINSITCLYMCGKGPRDLDVSETDMSMPGFQALCSAFQAVDDDEDYPKFLTKHKLPFSLETLARLKQENHESLKAETYTHLCHSHFELIPPPAPVPAEKSCNTEEAVISVNKSLDGAATEGGDGEDDIELAAKKQEKKLLDEEITKILKDAFDTTLSGAGDFSRDENDLVDLTDECAEAATITKTAETLVPTVDEFMNEHQMLRKSCCRATRADGRPVIICPSLYSLEIDDFTDDDDVVEASSNRKLEERETTSTRANPMYMDTLVETDEDGLKPSDREVDDTQIIKKATVNFVREAFKEAGSVAGKSDYTPDSDKSQLLFVTILENAKMFLQMETQIEGAEKNELTEAELGLVWDHSLKTTAKILRPAVPPHCTINDDTMDIFVEEFLKISSGMFYKLIQVPFFQDLFEQAATKGCIEETSIKEMKAIENRQLSSLAEMPYNKVVNDIVLKFLEEIIVRSAEIIGGGDPYNLRCTLGGQKSMNEFAGPEGWPSIVDITEEMVEPLVEKFFEAGGILAQDALTFKEEDATNQDDGIEPAKQYLEGVFKQLTDFLYQVKEEDEKVKDRIDGSAKKFTFSTKPLRIVLNRPFFRGYEPVMASKLAAFLMNNDSVQCLHARKWDLGEDGMINLMDGLILNMNIVTLDLACNGIGAEGMRPLGEYIKRNQNLKHLLLNHNRLRNTGIQILTNSIEESSLISLNVAFNDVTEQGLNPFLEAVGKSSIYSLYVMGNCFTMQSCTILRDLFDSESLRQQDCDMGVQEIDGEPQLVRNSQARDLNEWYEVPASRDIDLVCPPYYMELYHPPKVSIFGAVDVEL